jgi:hypothetical protein
MHTKYLICAIVAVALAPALFHDSLNTTCKLFCLNSIRINGNHILAHLYYGNGPLSRSVVEVIINHEYVSNISTNSSGMLDVYAPLSIGKNALNMRYKNSAISYTVYYFGGSLGLLLVPVGAAVCLLIAAISERCAADKEIRMSFGSEGKAHHTVRDKKLVFDAIERLRRLNFRRHMVRKLPVTLDDITDALEEISCSNDRTGTSEFVRETCTGAYRGVLCSSEKPYREIAAKRIYESAMTTGTYALRDGMSLSAFLKENRIFHFEEVRSSTGLTFGTQCSINITLFTECEGRALATLMMSGTGKGAFALFNDLNGFLRVIQC